MGVSYHSQVRIFIVTGTPTLLFAETFSLFTVFGVAPATSFAAQMLMKPKSLACEMAAKSKNWLKGKEKLRAATIGAYGADPANWKYRDVAPGLGNYIMVESVSCSRPVPHGEGDCDSCWHTDETPTANFKYELLQALSEQLPTLCVRTAGSNRSAPMTSNVQLASRDIPVLMLDPTTRPSLAIAIPTATSSNETPEAMKHSHHKHGKKKAGKSEKVATCDETVDLAIEANKARHEELWALGKIQSYVCPRPPTHHASTPLPTAVLRD